MSKLNIRETNNLIQLKFGLKFKPRNHILQQVAFSICPLFKFQQFSIYCLCYANNTPYFDKSMRKIIVLLSIIILK